jgi:hypothetical protein
MRSTLVVFIHFLVLFSLISLSAFSQVGVRPVTVEVRENFNDEPVFYAINTTNTPYTISFYFSNLRNVVPVQNPYQVTSYPGQSKLLTLERSRGFQDNPDPASQVSYNYEFYYGIGCHDTEVNENIDYALPVGFGLNTSIDNLSYIGELTDNEAPEDFYGLSFSASRGDTIYASRRGTVGEVDQEFDDGELNKLFSSKTNSITILHEDCTFGTYNSIQQGSAFVKTGQQVEVGDPIALVAQKEDAENEGFRFLLTYRNPKYEQKGDQEYWKYAIPRYKIGHHSAMQLEPGFSYTSMYFSNIITQEMNDREQRLWIEGNVIDE